MTTPTKEQLDFLRSIDTPTVCNLVEMVAPERRGHGYTVKHLHCPFPDLPPIVGFAKTVTFRAKDKVPLGEAGYMQKRLDYLDYVAAAPQPAIMVMHDLDGEHAGFGAFWGEVQSNIHKALGALGVVTDGSIRDIPMIAPGFQMLAAMIVPSHAYVHVVDYGIDVTVAGMAAKSGDLIHADRHGAIVVPARQDRRHEGRQRQARRDRSAHHRGRQIGRRRRGHQGGDEGVIRAAASTGAINPRRSARSPVPPCSSPRAQHRADARRLTSTETGRSADMPSTTSGANTPSSDRTEPSCEFRRGGRRSAFATNGRHDRFHFRPRAFPRDRSCSPNGPRADEFCQRRADLDHQQPRNIGVAVHRIVDRHAGRHERSGSLGRARARDDLRKGAAVRSERNEQLDIADGRERKAKDCAIVLQAHDVEGGQTAQRPLVQNELHARRQDGVVLRIQTKSSLPRATLRRTARKLARHASSAGRNPMPPR